VALTVAGTDSGGGAGVAADLRTFCAHRVWGAVAVTAVTAQDTLGVQAVEPVAPAVIRAQIDSVLGDLGADAVKTGMLGSEAAVRAVAAGLRSRGAGPLVVDPVLRATTGRALLADEALACLTEVLLPLAALVTPNLAEAAALAGVPAVVDRDGMVGAAERILRTGAGAVLVTGGHLVGERAADCLLTPGAAPRWLVSDRIDDAGTHGSGCVLSAAVTARLALGDELGEACAAAKRYVTAAIAASVRVGRGEAAVSPPACC